MAILCYAWLLEVLCYSLVVRGAMFGCFFLLLFYFFLIWSRHRNEHSVFLFSRPAGRLKRTPVIYNIICKLPAPNTTRLVNYIYIRLGLVDSNHRIKSGVLGGTRTSNLSAEGRKSDRYTTRPPRL